MDLTDPLLTCPAATVRTQSSWLRELMFVLVKTLCRWYSTVRGLMKSRAPISGLEWPSHANRAICASCAVSWLIVSTVRLRARSPVARSSRAARAVGRVRARS